MLKNKKIVSLFLASAMLFSLAVPAMAASKVETQASQNRELMKTYTIPTDDKGIYKSAKGEYALITEGIVQEVDIREISFEDRSEFLEIMNDEGIPDEVKESLNAYYLQTEKSGNNNFTATLITPKVIGTTTNSDPMQPPAKLYQSTTYKDVKMQTWRLTYNNVTSSYATVSNGTGTVKKARNLTSIVLSLTDGVTKKATKKIPVAKAGMTAFDVFMNAYEHAVIPGRTGDILSVELVYDDIQQWTYSWLKNDWYLSLGTEKITVKRANLFQRYYDSNVKDFRDNTTPLTGFSEPFESADFASPWAKAYLRGTSPETQWIVGTFGNKTVHFSYSG